MTEGSHLKICRPEIFRKLWELTKVQFTLEQGMVTSCLKYIQCMADEDLGSWTIGCDPQLYLYTGSNSSCSSSDRRQ